MASFWQSHVWPFCLPLLSDYGELEIMRSNRPYLRSAESLSSERFSLPALAIVVTSCLLLVASSGCGPKTDRLQISGDISLDGSPLDQGAIEFLLNEGEKLLSSGAVIKDGKFFIPREKGLPPGTYHLSISSADTEGPKVLSAPRQQGGIPVYRDRIPSKYNSDSQETIEVTPSGDNHFVFDILSQP